MRQSDAVADAGRTERLPGRQRVQDDAHVIVQRQGRAPGELAQQMRLAGGRQAGKDMLGADELGNLHGSFLQSDSRSR